MIWRDLLSKPGERLIFPWVGGQTLRKGMRAWTIEGRWPAEFGWYEFEINGRAARLCGPESKPDGSLSHTLRGFLVGTRLVQQDARVEPDPAKIFAASEQVFLIDEGLDRFVLVTVGRMCEDGPLIYDGMAMPLGVEEEVLNAFHDKLPSVDHIKGVPPALDAAFRMEVRQRQEAERRRVELERLRREEEERLAKEARRQELVEKLGDGAGRRAMAAIDFGEAARAALAVGGAEYLDHRRAQLRGEMVVKFRLNRDRYTCTCDERTLQIIDSGICLVDHYTEERGDTFFTLESLPGVILQAQREGVLHVWRHD